MGEDWRIYLRFFRLAEPSASQYRDRVVSSYPIIARLDAIYQRRGDERRRGQRDRY